MSKTQEVSNQREPRGTSLQIIAETLGHKSLRSTEIYARLITDPVRNSVEKATQKILGYCRNQSENTLADETQHDIR
jgi:hypothetical protein